MLGRLFAVSAKGRGVSTSCLLLRQVSSKTGLPYKERIYSQCRPFLEGDKKNFVSISFEISTVPLLLFPFIALICYAK